MSDLALVPKPESVKIDIGFPLCTRDMLDLASDLSLAISAPVTVPIKIKTCLNVPPEKVDEALA